VPPMAHYPVYSISSGAQAASEFLFGGLALLALAYCGLLARREHKAWPLSVFGGSMLLITYEPINNFLGHCAYPTPGQHTMLGYLGQHVPRSTWFIYMFYFSVAVPFVMQKLERGITMRTLWKYYAVAVVICGAFEPVFANVHLGVRWWFYYGSNQAMNFTGLPMFWWFANAMIVLVTAMTFHLLKKHLFARDWQSLSFVILEPLLLIGVHGSAGIPYYVAITSAHSKPLSTLGLAGSIAIDLFYMLLFGKAVTVPADASRTMLSGESDPAWRAATVPERPAVGVGV
jgi:hypothetical protein